MMPDREKVKKGLECCLTLDSPCGDCPYYSHEDIQELDCERNLRHDALAMLKEQEAVMPNVSSVNQRCGNCNKVIEMDGWKTCPWCGKPIDWARWWRENTNGVRHDGGTD